MFHEFLFAHFLFFPVTGIIMKLLRKFVCYIRGFQLRCTFGTALNIDAPLISGMHDTHKKLCTEGRHFKHVVNHYV